MEDLFSYQLKNIKGVMNILKKLCLPIIVKLILSLLFTHLIFVFKKLFKCRIILLFY